MSNEEHYNKIVKINLQPYIGIKWMQDLPVDAVKMIVYEADKQNRLKSLTTAPDLSYSISFIDSTQGFEFWSDFWYHQKLSVITEWYPKANLTLFSAYVPDDVLKENAKSENTLFIKKKTFKYKPI